MYKSLLISVLCVSGALAQTVTMVQGPNMVQASGPVAIGFAKGPGMGVSHVTGAPYSAQMTTTQVQTLADGNRITQTMTGDVARDSQGRVRRDETLPIMTPSGGEAPQLIFIEDSVAGVMYALDAQKKTATKMPMMIQKPGTVTTSGGGEMGVTIMGGGVGGGFATQSFKTSGGPLSDPNNVTKTDLGTQTMEGVTVQGTRITHTIPAGQIGNDQPITITTETWFSPDLKVLVMSKSSDPRMGDTTFQLSNVQRTEPTASLFTVPADYTIQDAPTKNFVFSQPAQKSQE